jgi:ParB family chromosome partitioning protein
LDAQTSAIVAIPLDSLRVSELNARRRAGKSVEELAASIAAEGLLQNLNVTDAGDGTFEIVAGNRRFHAMRLLRERGTLPTELSSVPCRIVSNGRASSASLAENVVREAMHAADEFVAFKRLADEGRSIEAIAQEFGVEPVVVERRLRIANAAPSLFELFREDKIDLAQIMALSVTDDHAAQERVWKNARQEWQRRPDELRKKLTKGEIDIARDAAAAFVGAADLEKAGAVVRRDLFNDAGGGFVTDRALVDELALTRLEKIADEIRASETWKWVEAAVAFDMYASTKGGGYYAKLQAEPGRTRLAKADNDRLRAIKEELAELGDPGEFTDDQEARWDALKTERENIIGPGEPWTDAQRAAAGVMVTISHGKLNVIRGLVRPGEKKPSATRDSGGGSASPAPKKKPEDLSDALTARLTAHRTAVLQRLVLTNPPFALRVLAHRLLLDVFYPDRFQPCACTVKVERIRPLDQLASELPMMRYHAEATERIEAIKATLPPATGLFAWLLSVDDVKVVELLTASTSLTIDAVMHSRAAKDPAADELVAALGVDFADHWAPTRETFLAHVPRATIEHVIRQACSEADVKKLDGLKKDEVVAVAEELLATKRWLPKVLRGPKAKAAPESGEAPSTPSKKAAKPKRATTTSPTSAKKPAAKKAAKRKTKSK